jgi:F0F1-type ATP synthase gamma subunit
MNTGDRARFEKAAQKILDVFSDGRVRDHDLMYVAFYTVINSYPEVVLDRIIDYTEHVKTERNRIREDQQYVQDSLF